MATTPPNSPVVVHKDVHLPAMPAFIASLQAALQEKGTAPEKARELILNHASAECLACKIRIKGDELLLLDPQSAVMDVPPKISRLRQGYCARQTCDTYFYRVELANQPGLDWAQYLPETENKVAEAQAAPTAEQMALKRIERKQLLMRVGAGVVLVLVALLIKQIYQGGEIPLIRQAEKFEVDRFPTITNKPAR